MSKSWGAQGMLQSECQQAGQFDSAPLQNSGPDEVSALFGFPQSSLLLCNQSDQFMD